MEELAPDKGGDGCNGDHDKRVQVATVCSETSHDKHGLALKQATNQKYPVPVRFDQRFQIHGGHHNDQHAPPHPPRGHHIYYTKHYHASDTVACWQTHAISV